MSPFLVLGYRVSPHDSWVLKGRFQQLLIRGREGDHTGGAAVRKQRYSTQGETDISRVTQSNAFELLARTKTPTDGSR